MQQSIYAKHKSLTQSKTDIMIVNDCDCVGHIVLELVMQDS
jgi:hypothetical protein